MYYVYLASRARKSAGAAMAATTTMNYGEKNI